MAFRKYFPLTILVALISITTFSACSDDDDGPTDPNNGLHQLYIDFRPGDTFVYDRYVLDNNNQPVQESKHDYQVQMIKGTSSLLGYDDWFNRLGRDMVSGKKDTMFVRAENITRDNGTAYTKELWAYGLRNTILSEFVALMQENLATNAPNIPSEEWDVIGKYYNDAGTPVDVGTEWNLGPAEGDELNFDTQWGTIRVVAKLKAAYTGREEKLTVNDKEVVLTWKTTISGSFTLTAFNLTLNLTLHMVMSDDPSGPMQMIQESINLDMPPLPAVSEPGDMMTVKSWF